MKISEAKVFNHGAQLFAHGTSTLMALPGKGISMEMPKFSRNRNPVQMYIF